MCWLQLLKCEYLKLFFVIHDNKLNIFWIFGLLIRKNKTKHELLGFIYSFFQLPQCYTSTYKLQYNTHAMTEMKQREVKPNISCLLQGTNKITKRQQRGARYVNKHNMAQGKQTTKSLKGQCRMYSAHVNDE